MVETELEVTSLILSSSWTENPQNLERRFGLTFDSAVGFTTTGCSMVQQFFGMLGVKLRDAYDSMVSLQKVIGAGFWQQGTCKKYLGSFSAQLGISTDLSAEFLKTMSSISDTTLDTIRIYSSRSENLARTEGVNAVAVEMNDIVKSSQGRLFIYSKSTERKSSKRQIEAKKFGTSIESAAQSSKGIIEFPTVTFRMK